jgi:hypothetical protein
VNSDLDTCTYLPAFQANHISLSCRTLTDQPGAQRRQGTMSQSSDKTISDLPLHLRSTRLDPSAATLRARRNILHDVNSAPNQQLSVNTTAAMKRTPVGASPGGVRLSARNLPSHSTKSKVEASSSIQPSSSSDEEDQLPPHLRIFSKSSKLSQRSLTATNKTEYMSVASSSSSEADRYETPRIHTNKD